MSEMIAVILVQNPKCSSAVEGNGFVGFQLGTYFDIRFRFDSRGEASVCKNL